ncbi:MAG TPA: AAA family ATPase [Stellaceae bacterium]|nr:AAA family ATPase [Stellaceae bacterium]
MLWPIATKGSPFRGLASFGAKHAAVFFGRGRDISRAVDEWKAAAERGTPFLLVIGASGAGKSSLARAGLVPRITAPGVVPEIDLWRVAALRPSAVPGGPFASLATRLLDGLGDVPEEEAGRPPALPELAESDFRTPAELAELLRHADAAAVTPIIRALDRIGEVERGGQGFERPLRVDLLLLIDQLDELFAADVEAAERAGFAALLGCLAATRRVWIVATLRADLYERFLGEPALLALKTGGAAYDLAPPGPAELAEIVRQPAAAADLVFETDPATGERLDERLLREADRPDMLPLLQLALNRLFEGRIVVGGETRLTLAAFDELGGLAGVVDREAERAVGALGAAELAALPRLLRRLVAVAHGPAGAGGAGLTIRTMPLAEAAEDEPARRLVTALVEARILLISGEGSDAGVHLAHQRVLTDWARAREQIAADTEFFRVRDEIEEQRRRWEAAGQRPELLLPRGLPLAEAEAVSARFGGELGADTHAFIAASGRRARRRQRLTAIAAVVFALVGIGATVAGVIAWNQRQYAIGQQQRAEREQARAEAQQKRAEAEKLHATAALRATKREVARTLAAQVQVALRQPDEHRALALAVQAGKAEEEVRDPGEIPASEPALLAALGAAREVLHVKGASQVWWLPYAFLDDGTLVYADGRSGLTAVDLQAADLQNEPRRIAQVPFPQPEPATRMALLPSRHLAAVAAGDTLLVIDIASQKVQQRLTWPERINALDIDPAGHRAVLAVGSGIAFVDLDKPETSAVIDVPDTEGAKVGQVRFMRSGATVLASDGVKLTEYDLAGHSFAPVAGKLSGAGRGIDEATLASIVADGKIDFIRVVPEIGGSARFFTVAPMALQTFEDSQSPARTLPRDELDAEFVGLSPLDQTRVGHPTTTVAVLSRTLDDRQVFELRYVSGKDGILLTKDGRMFPPFATLTVAAGALDGKKPSSCKVSPQGTFLACQYWSKELQGLVVWRLLGGAHSFERVAELPFASSGIWLPAADRLLATTDDGIASVSGGTQSKLTSLSEDWRLTGFDGRYVAAVSPEAQQVEVFAASSGGAKLETVLGPLPGRGLTLVPDSSQALVHGPDGLSLADLETGKTLWTAPTGPLSAVQASADGKHIIAVGAAAAYAIEAGSGRILASVPISAAADVPVAIDPPAQRIAYANTAGDLAVTTVASGTTKTIAKLGESATRLIWSRDASRLLIGDRDGAVHAWDDNQGQRVLIPSPIAGAVRENALPGQPPQGAVLDIALSHDGRRIAVIRQDMASVDIYDLAAGRPLTALTPPWSTMKVPATVLFAGDDAIVTAWAVHPLVRGKPRFVTVHRLPRTFDETLAAATAHLVALNDVWSAEAPPKK